MSSAWLVLRTAILRMSSTKPPIVCPSDSAQAARNSFPRLVDITNFLECSEARIMVVEILSYDDPRLLLRQEFQVRCRTEGPFGAAARCVTGSTLMLVTMLCTDSPDYSFSKLLYLAPHRQLNSSGQRIPIAKLVAASIHNHLRTLYLVQRCT